MGISKFVWIALCAIFLGSCSKRSKPSIGNESPSVQTKIAPIGESANLSGKWRLPTGGVIEFRGDGTANMSGPNGSREVMFRVTADQVIEISRPGGNAQIFWKIEKLSSDELAIIDSDGMRVTMKRI